MKLLSNLRWRTREALKDLGGAVLLLAILVISTSLWIFVFLLASKGFFELWDPLGYIFVFVYIGLTIAAYMTWHNYSFVRNNYNYIIVHLRVTDEQRKALGEQTVALGYADSYGGLQARVSNLLELELKERFPEMLARHATWRANIMSEWQSKKQT